MKALSLWQPWASAIPLGLKKIETRGWSTKYRGPLAIHAAKCWNKEQRAFAEGTHANLVLPSVLPFGCIVAVANLVDVATTDELLKIGINSVEELFGNYEPGRFGFLLDNIRSLDQPVPFKGAQGFFNVPDELLA